MEKNEKINSEVVSDISCEIVSDKLSEKQIALLCDKLSENSISFRQGKAGASYAYLKTHHVIDVANRIFGFDGWSYSVDKIDILLDNTVLAIVTIRAGGVSRSDVGIGAMGDDIELKIKTAVSDALKRAFRTFGNQFGNSLYEKEKHNSPPQQSQQQNRFAGRGMASEKQINYLQRVLKTNGVELSEFTDKQFKELTSVEAADIINRAQE